jgi:hypothetical protein
MEDKPYDLRDCEQCSIEFKAPRWSSGKSSTRRYCDECLSKKFATNKREEDHYVDKHGYAQIRINGKLMAEHRYVMEQKLGRPLKEAESVHHINGIRHDNNPDNLELWVGPIRYGQRAADIKCHHCGESYKID